MVASFSERGRDEGAQLILNITLLNYPEIVSRYLSVSKECPADGVLRMLQGSVSRHTLLDTVNPPSERHLNNVH